MGQNTKAATVSAAVLALLLLIASIRVMWQYERGVQFRLGRVVAVREPGLRLIIPIVDRLLRVSMRIVTMPIQSQGIITRDNVSVDIAAVAYFRVIDARKAVVVIENVSQAPTSPGNPQRWCSPTTISAPSSSQYTRAVA